MSLFKCMPVSAHLPANSAVIMFIFCTVYLLTNFCALSFEYTNIHETFRFALRHKGRNV